MNRTENGKPRLLLLITTADNPDVALIVPTLAWIARENGMEFEMYLENQRDGLLFAQTGSTVIGGNHFQQFNYLCAAYDVRAVLYGAPKMFQSSIEAFRIPVLSRAGDPASLYADILKAYPCDAKEAVVFDDCFLPPDGEHARCLAYFYPEIYFRKAFGFFESSAGAAKGYEKIHRIDGACAREGVKGVSKAVGARWEASARGVAFGDPDAIVSMLATLCRDEFVALYGETTAKPQREIEVSAYTEECSSVSEDVMRLAKSTGNRVVIGRQTGDGDLIEWAKAGVCMKIMDPNRPAFPCVTRLVPRWHNREADWNEREPDDETLLRYAKEGKVLASLLFHSGEMAHNEAMINLFDLASTTGIKIGIGVHAARYETCPQLWELLSVPRESGGVKGLIEPVLHSGGMGVMADRNCPGEFLLEHAERALERIREIGGDAALPKGYMAFLDTDLATLQSVDEGLFQTVERSGLTYFVSSARPGRNRVLYRGKDLVAINQTPRNICMGSPYVRISELDDINESEWVRPGWILGTLDSPVVSFSPYVWRRGYRFMELVDWLTGGKVVNVLPHTISRYARILQDGGWVR